MKSTSHHDLREIMLGRIQSGEWTLGALIPNEMNLAEEYGCARTTVNRALQALADDGLLIRKRKGGTRVCSMPIRKAKFEIPIIREQVAETGAQYSHHVVLETLKRPPLSIQAQLQLELGQDAVHIQTLHLADNTPFAFEDRWVNIKAVPEILNAPLTDISANEWLVKTVPFSNGEVVFSAVNADSHAAEKLGTKAGAALFVIDRRTWLGGIFITAVRLYYKEGYTLFSKI